MDCLNIEVNENEIGVIAKITMPNGDVLVDSEYVDTYVFQSLEDYVLCNGFKIEFEDGQIGEFVYVGRGLTEENEPCFFFDSQETMLKNKYKQKLNV